MLSQPFGLKTVWRTAPSMCDLMLYSRFIAPALITFVGAMPAFAGLHYSGEQFAELPSRPPGFLVDHRALRAAGFERPDGLPSPLRGDYVSAATRLEKLAKTRVLT